ncbi:hypothetical protein AB0N07_47095 [Streptomyces sp. NPDC051172]|uniref:hypothetical protein n=1 Tax=Streptomyces sp. NPDC051172 TaxID=3155796 RepID=UPI0034365BDB
MDVQVTPLLEAVDARERELGTAAERFCAQIDELAAGRPRCRTARTAATTGLRAAGTRHSGVCEDTVRSGACFWTWRTSSWRSVR